MGKPGDTLHRVTEVLERVLNAERKIRIKAPGKLRDERTGQVREHDVLVEYELGHHSMVMSIECRDRSRPVGVPQLEAFYQKCRDTGIDRPVFVSSSGFAKTAIVKARSLRVECLSIELVEQFAWVLAKGMHLFLRKPIQTDLTVFPATDEMPDLEGAIIVNVDDVEITTEILNANIHKIMQKKETKIRPEDHEKIAELWEQERFTVKFPGRNLFLKEKSGRKLPLKELVASTQFSVERKLVPFTFQQYSNAESGAKIADAVIAEVEEDRLSGEFVIVHDEQNGSTIHWVPRATTKT